MLCRRRDGASQLVRIQTRTSVCISFGSDKTAENFETYTNSRSLIRSAGSHAAERACPQIEVANQRRVSREIPTQRIQVRFGYRLAGVA